MNKMSMDIIIIFVIAVICAGLVEGTCPSTCSCGDYSSGSHVNCYSKYLGRMPTVPNDTYHLLFSFNLIIKIAKITFADCEQLHYINLRDNKIRSIESNTFVNLTNLYQLNLYNNEIYAIEPFTFMDLPNLYYLHLQINKIKPLESIMFNIIRQLEHMYIYLDNNNISTIKAFTFMNLPSLRYLYLHNNKIRSLESNTFINMTKLYRLDMQHNAISTIEAFTFMNLPNLYYLYLDYNKIRSLESNTFINMTNLYQLDLQYNAISTIEAFTFMNIPSLYYLYLGGNNISDIKEHAFGNLTYLTLLELSGNPLNCDCSIFAFWSWLIERSSTYNIGSSATCSNGTLVKSLQSAVLDTCHPDNCQCFNGGKCVAMGYELICDCLGQWTGTFCQDSQCTSYDCGFGDCYIEPVNGTAQCLCADGYVNYCPV